MGGPVLQAFINLKDNASAKLAMFTKNVNSATTSIGKMNSKLGQMGTSPVINKAVGQQSKLGQAIANTNKQYQAQLAAHRKMEASMNRQGMSTSRLIAMMVKFGIILKALQIVTAPLGLISMGVGDIITTDKGVRNIMGMLSKAGDTPQMLATRYRQLTIASRELQTSHGLMADDIVKGQYKIASVISTINWQKMFTNQADAITYLTSKAADLAVGGFIPLEDASSGLATILSSMRLDVSKTDEVLDTMFQTVAIGSVEMGGLAQEVGGFLGFLKSMTPAGKEMKFFDETMAIFGYLTTQIPVAEAGTAMKRMLQMAGNMTPEGRAMGQALTGLSGGQIRFGGAEFANLGPKGYFENVLKVAGPQSQFLKAFAEQRYGRPARPEEMIGISTAILDKLFGDSRALVGVLALANDEMSGINDAWDLMANKQGSAKRAQDQGAQSFENRLNVLRGNLSVFSQELLEGGVAGFYDLIDQVNAGFADLRSDKNAWSMMTGDQRLNALLDRLGPAFTKAGEAAGVGFLQAMGGGINRAIGGRGLGELFNDAVNNPIARGAATFFGLMAVGVPWPLAIALAAGAGASAAKDLNGKPLLDPAQQGIFGMIAGFATMALAINTVKSVFTKLVTTFIASKGIMSALFGPAIGVMNWVRAGSNYGGSTYRTGAVSPVPGRAGGRTAAPIPGMMIPGVGYMQPPMGPGGRRLLGWNYSGQSMSGGTSRIGGQRWTTNAAGVPQQVGGGGGRLGGVAGRMFGGVGSALGNIGVGILVSEAVNQIFETVMLIADNWDKFVFALRSNKLGDIPIFGAVFSLLRNIQMSVEAWNNAPWNRAKGTVPSGPGVVPPGGLAGPSQVGPSTPLIPRLDLPVPGGRSSSFDTQGRVISSLAAPGSTTVYFQPTLDVSRHENPEEFAARVLAVLGDAMDEATGNAGNTTARSIISA